MLMSETTEKNISMLLSIFGLHLGLNLIIYLINGNRLEDTQLFYNVYSNLVIIGYGLVAAVFLFVISKRFGVATNIGKVWVFIGVGVLLFVLGDSIWAFYELVLETESPFPSIADVIYLLAYPLVFIGIFLQVRSLQIKLPKSEVVIIAIIQIVISAVIVAFLMVPMITSEINEEFTMLMLFISLAYVIFDLPLFFGALMLIFKYKGGQFSRVWLVIAGALISMSMADWIFAYYNWNNLLLIWGAYDHFFILFYQLIIVACLYMSKMIKK